MTTNDANLQQRLPLDDSAMIGQIVDNLSHMAVLLGLIRAGSASEQDAADYKQLHELTSRQLSALLCPFLIEDTP